MSGIPLKRILERVERALTVGDTAEAERLLLYWQKDAESTSDLRGAFAISNELVGFYRKAGRRDECYAACERVLTLSDVLQLGGSVSGATALVNVATARKAFGDFASALALYENARTIYESRLLPNDSRLGGLYNNMALALADAGRFDEALETYRKALKVMHQVTNGELEQAITYLNIAELCEKRDGLEKGAKAIFECVSKAELLLNMPNLPRDGYYAFVAEKCAPALDYYGSFVFAEELLRRARAIREGAEL